MPLGYCMECQKLTPICKVAIKILSREADWAPMEHDKPQVLCQGDLNQDVIEHWSDDLNDYYWGCPSCDFTCSSEEFCSGLPDHAAFLEGSSQKPERCPGVGRIIR